MVPGPLAHIVVRLPRPEGVLVELDPLVRSPAEDHRSQAAIADRQGLLPRARRLLIPAPRVGGLVVVRRRPGTIDFWGGPVPYPEPQCHCPACRRDFFPSASHPAADAP